MLIPDISTALLYAGLAAFLIWRIYSRVRRMVGRQRLSRWRPRATIVFFPILLVILIAESLTEPMSILALLGGVALGVVLGIAGHRLTRFECMPDGLFYTPNAHLGIALSLLLMLRIGYRMVPLLLAGEDALTMPADFTRSPLTLLLLGMLTSYYVTYAIGLLRWSRRVSSSVADQKVPQ